MQERTRRCLGLCIMLLTMAGNCPAQFNDSTHYYVKYATTGIINRTDDARSFVLTNALNFQVSKKKMTFNSSNAWIYGRDKNGLTNNDLNAVLNADLLKNMQKLYYWGLVSFTSSYSLKINYQFQVGAGIGYNVMNRENAELVVSDGMLYETSDLQLPSGVNDKYQTVRNSFRIRHKWVINDLLTFEGTHFWQPSLEDISDYIIRSNTSLSVKLRKWLSLTTAVFYNKINRTRRENLLVNFGLTAEKYF